MPLSDPLVRWIVSIHCADVKIGENTTGNVEPMLNKVAGVL